MSELKKGIEVELEHKPTYDWFVKEMILQRVPSIEEFAKQIAIDHLNEHKDYYDYLEVIEDVMAHKDGNNKRCKHKKQVEQAEPL